MSYRIQENIEKAFLRYLQSDIIMLLDGKKYRAGRFQNFKMMDLYVQVEFTVNNNTKLRKVDLPIPFKLEDTPDGIIFSYKLEDMGGFGATLEKIVKKGFGSNLSRLYNRRLLIKRVV